MPITQLNSRKIAIAPAMAALFSESLSRPGSVPMNKIPG